jgi:acetyltransferase-like isoleucine patch superfamily enzyme
VARWRRRRPAATSGDRLHAFASFGEGSRIVEPVVGIPNPTGISIGRGVDIRAYAFLEALAPPNVVVLTVGDRTYVGPFVRITALGGVSIGSDVLIADRVYISDSGHVYDDVTRPIKDQGMREGRRLRIEDGAWIGTGAAIVGDVTVGRNAVVGANAVVHEDVEPRTVVAGNPARVIRRHDADGWRTLR